MTGTTRTNHANWTGTNLCAARAQQRRCVFVRPTHPCWILTRTICCDRTTFAGGCNWRIQGVRVTLEAAVWTEERPRSVGA
ncbi:MAG: hypothetical protein ACK56I_29170, partial [bacterium]